MGDEQKPDDAVVGAQEKPDDAVVGAFDATSEPEVPEGIVKAVTYDPEPEREKVRGRIAYLLTFLLIFEMVMVSFLAAWGKPPPDLAKLTAALITPVIGVTGLVFGFYYAGKGPAK